MPDGTCRADVAGASQSLGACFAISPLERRDIAEGIVQRAEQDVERCNQARCAGDEKSGLAG